MKKAICVFLACLLLLLTGCTHSGKSLSSFESPSNFYYRVTDPVYGAKNGIIVAEAHETAGCGQDLLCLLQRYMEGPYSQNLKIPTPVPVSSIYPVSAVQEGAHISVSFNPGFARLTGIDLSIACGCISRTLFDYTDATEVEFFVENFTLDGNSSILIRRDGIITSDENTLTTEPTKGGS